MYVSNFVAVVPFS